VAADARLAGSAVVEEDRLLADLSPGHDVLPLALVEATLADVVLDLHAVVLALEVAHLLVEDQSPLLVDFGHLDEDDVGRLLAGTSQRVRDFDVGACGSHTNEENGQQQPAHAFLLAAGPPGTGYILTAVQNRGLVCFLILSVCPDAVKGPGAAGCRAGDAATRHRAAQSLPHQRDSRGRRARKK